MGVLRLSKRLVVPTAGERRPRWPRVEHLAEAPPPQHWQDILHSRRDAPEVRPPLAHTDARSRHEFHAFCFLFVQPHVTFPRASEPLGQRESLPSACGTGSGPYLAEVQGL